MILSVFTSYPIPPRLKKISRLFGEDITYIAWNGKEYLTPTINNDLILDNQPGNNGIMKYFGIVGFRRLLKNTISHLKPELIVCRGWPSFFIVRSINCSTQIVYDVCDMPNKAIIRIIEGILIRKSDLVLLASRFYVNRYNLWNWHLYENRVTRQEIVSKEVSNKLRITFLGVIRYKEILKNLICACNHFPSIELVFWGFGNDYCEIDNYIKQTGSHAKLKGQYEEKDIPYIYSQSDIVWCAYPYRLKNVKSAISNKFFETIAYRTPGIFFQVYGTRHVSGRKRNRLRC